MIFEYKETEPRLARVVMIRSAIITLMFASAALNAYTNPDVSVCALYVNTTEVRESDDISCEGDDMSVGRGEGAGATGGSGWSESIVPVIRCRFHTRPTITCRAIARPPRA